MVTSDSADGTAYLLSVDIDQANSLQNIGCGYHRIRQMRWNILYSIFVVGTIGFDTWDGI
jgi:hypothetical protein